MLWQQSICRLLSIDALSRRQQSRAEQPPLFFDMSMMESPTGEGVERLAMSMDHCWATASLRHFAFCMPSRKIMPLLQEDSCCRYTSFAFFFIDCCRCHCHCHCHSRCCLPRRCCTAALPLSSGHFLHLRIQKLDSQSGCICGIVKDELRWGRQLKPILNYHTHIHIYILYICVCIWYAGTD